MATRTTPEGDDAAVAVERSLPASLVFNVWTPILAGLLSALLSVVVIMQE
jgi:hypothetical protein